MNILVTVGTTPFDNLILAVDQQLGSLYQVVSQIAKGKYEPKSNHFFRFTDDIERYYQDADLIISHGGAGTIYRVLELGKKLIIVPNLDRIDHHQLDICDFMQKNNHAAVWGYNRCRSQTSFDSDTSLAKLVAEVEISDFVPFEPDEFTGVDKIRDYLGLNDKAVPS